MQRAFTVRFSPSEAREVEATAARMGVSKSELLRLLWSNKTAKASSENDSTQAAILAALEELLERDAERESSASSNAELEQIRTNFSQLNDTISAIIAAIQRQESALLSLAEHVKISRSSASVTQQRNEQYTPHPAPPPPPEPPAQPAPTRPVPGRPHWRVWLAEESKKHADSGETLIQRNLRLKKVYAQIYGPIDD